jgi:hypothetical protein
MIKIAVISDTHAHLDSRIADIIRDCDYAVHAGDICGEDILESMQPKTGKVIAVTGNNDPYCHLTGASLPEILSFEVAGETITVEHGHLHGAHQPCHDSLRKTHPDAKIIIYGHTHKKVIDKSATPWVINPGAAGKTRTHGGPSCLVIECEENNEWQIKKYRFSEAEV